MYASWRMVRPVSHAENIHPSGHGDAHRSGHQAENVLFRIDGTGILNFILNFERKILALSEKYFEKRQYFDTQKQRHSNKKAGNHYRIVVSRFLDLAGIEPAVI